MDFSSKDILTSSKHTPQIQRKCLESINLKKDLYSNMQKLTKLNKKTKQNKKQFTAPLQMTTRFEQILYKSRYANEKKIPCKNKHPHQSSRKCEDFLKVSFSVTLLRRNDTWNMEMYIPFDSYIRQALFYSIFH